MLLAEAPSGVLTPCPKLASWGLLAYVSPACTVACIMAHLASECVNDDIGGGRAGDVTAVNAADRLGQLRGKHLQLQVPGSESIRVGKSRKRMGQQGEGRAGLGQAMLDCAVLIAAS